METEEWRIDPNQPALRGSSLGKIEELYGTSWINVPLRIANGKGKYLKFCRRGVASLVHIYLAKLFQLPNDNPTKNNQVGHRNNDDKDNRISNLYWTNQSENNKNSGQNISDAQSIGEWHCGDRVFLSSRHAERELGISAGRIRRICRERLREGWFYIPN